VKRSILEFNLVKKISFETTSVVSVVFTSQILVKVEYCVSS